MAISVVQTKTGTANSSSITLTLSSATTAGNCLVVCVAFGPQDGTAPGTVSNVKLGGAADNFAQAASIASSGGSVPSRAAIWVDPNCAGGQTSVVVTLSTGQIICAEVYEVSGLAASSVVDQTSTNQNASSSTWTSNATPTTTQASEIFFGCLSAVSATPSGPAAYTNTLVSNSVTRLWSGYDIVSSTGTATYNGTAGGSSGWAAAVVTLKAASSNVSVSLTPAQVNAAAPAPGVQAGPVALPVARVNITAYPPIPGQVFALPVAQVTVAALPPGIQRGWTLALPVAQVTVSARPPAPSVNVAVALTPAQVTIAALPPKVARQLLISLASASGTDDYGTAFPQGILATAGVIEGPVLVGSDAFFYSPSPGFGNLTQSITEADGTDQYGNAYIAGTATYTDNGSFWSAVVIAGGVVTWYQATGPGGPWTSEAGIGFNWNSLTGGGLEFTGPAGNDMTGDLNVSGSITVTTTLTVAGTDVGATLSAIHAALSGASTSNNGLNNGTISGTSGSASAGTAHTHGPGSFSVTDGHHSHTLPTF